MPPTTYQPGTRAAFTLSAFGDEIDADLETQLRVMGELGIRFLELRAAWGTNVADLDDRQVEAIKTACERSGVGVSCIGSPVGKSLIAGPLEAEREKLDRVLRIADALGTDRVRVFSFYPSGEGEGQQDRYLEEAVSRLRRMARKAEDEGVALLLENEVGVVGDTPQRCRSILEAVDSAALRFVWDTANFPHAGVRQPVERGWPLLSPHVAHVQIKDFRIADRTVRAAGEGDGQIPELLARLRDAGYQGFLALEPHLATAGRAGGFSGPDGMRHAASALRRVMADAGCVEAQR
jgi:sugar phosphate isomerase/epimerase